jgi:hypothetical protein
VTDLCEVCKRQPPMCVVASTLVPYSYAICRDCLSIGAEPVLVVATMLEQCEGDWRRIRAEVRRNLKVFMDGEYRPCTDVKLGACEKCGKPTAAPKVCFWCYMEEQRAADQGA